jgi:hypothetical protein
MEARAASIDGAGRNDRSQGCVGIGAPSPPIGAGIRDRVGRPALASDLRGLIRQMRAANPLWGAPRIHGELHKLGIDVSQACPSRRSSAR